MLEANTNGGWSSCWRQTQTGVGVHAGGKHKRGLEFMLEANTNIVLMLWKQDSSEEIDQTILISQVVSVHINPAGYVLLIDMSCN